MKKIITFWVLFFVMLSNAQVTEIFMPSGYYSPGSNIDGASYTLCQKNGFLYVATSIAGNYGKIFKINQNTNEVTAITENTSFYLLNSSDIEYLGEYNDKIFFTVWGNGICMLDTSNNTFTTNYFGVSNVSGYTGRAIFNGYAYNGIGQRKNIDTGVVSDLIYSDGTQNVTAYIGEYTVIGNEMIGIELNSTKLLKFTNTGLYPILSNSSNIESLPQERKIFKINNKYVFMRSAQPSILVSLPDNSSTEQTILTTTNGDIYYTLFKLMDKLYFYQQGDGSFKRTDGNTVENSNLHTNLNYNPFGNNNFTSRGQEFMNFLEFNNKVYSLSYDGSGQQNSPRHLISYDGNSTSSISEFSEMNGATIYNNTMFFQASAFDSSNNWFSSIFRFDGTNTYKLNLGNVLGQLNSYRGQILGYNNYLFFTNGYSVVKIDLNTVTSSLYSSNFLAINEINNDKSKYIIYPNPAKSQITLQNNKNENFKYIIVDLTGRIIKNGNSKFNEQINIESLESGNYIIQIQTENGEKMIDKLIKN